MTISLKSDKPVISSYKEDLVMLIGGTWLIIGLFVDGYAHSEIIDTETEDFFTPWHAIFYSGFTVTASWVGWMAYQRASVEPIRTWLPDGYGLAAIGIAIFALGGIGDGIWHTIFGVETGVDALLSPTHLFLFLGLLLILTAPFQAALLKPNDRLNWISATPVVLSLTLATSLVTFFVSYAWGLSQNWTLNTAYDSSTGEGNIYIVYGLAAGFISTIVLVLPALVLLRRWILPFGAIVLLWVAPTTLEMIAFGGDATATLAAGAGGLVFELTLVMFRRNLGRRHLIILASSLGATALWASRLLIVEIDQPDFILWPAELWGGQIIFGGLIALALALITVPDLDTQKP